MTRKYEARHVYMTRSLLLANPTVFGIARGHLSLRNADSVKKTEFRLKPYFMSLFKKYSIFASPVKIIYCVIYAVTQSLRQPIIGLRNLTWSLCSIVAMHMKWVQFRFVQYC